VQRGLVRAAEGLRSHDLRLQTVRASSAAQLSRIAEQPTSGVSSRFSAPEPGLLLHRESSPSCTTTQTSRPQPTPVGQQCSKARGARSRGTAGCAENSTGAVAAPAASISVPDFSSAMSFPVTRSAACSPPALPFFPVIRGNGIGCPAAPASPATRAGGNVRFPVPSLPARGALVIAARISASGHAASGEALRSGARGRGRIADRDRQTACALLLRTFGNRFLQELTTIPFCQDRVCRAASRKQFRKSMERLRGVLKAKRNFRSLRAGSLCRCSSMRARNSCECVPNCARRWTRVRQSGVRFPPGSFAARSTAQALAITAIERGQESCSAATNRRSSVRDAV